MNLVTKIKLLLGEFIYKLLVNYKRDWIMLENPRSLRNNFKSSTKEEFVKIDPIYNIFNSNIGSYTYISKNSSIINTTIGRFCSIGPNLVSGWGIHPTNGLSTSPMFYSTKKQNGMTLSKIDKIAEYKPIVIGNDVFIGMNVCVLDGVNIGDGAIIGAGAVVSKDIPPYAIAIGNPIRILRYRFNHDQIQKLLEIKWWDFNEEKLQEIEKHFYDTDMFINKFKL